MNFKTLSHQINLGLIRDTQISLEYKEQNSVISTELHSPTTGLISGVIYFENFQVMTDFQDCLKNPKLLFYSHPKVTVALQYQLAKKL